jgi:hypothetical protein
MTTATITNPPTVDAHNDPRGWCSVDGTCVQCDLELQARADRNAAFVRAARSDPRGCQVGNHCVRCHIARSGCANADCPHCDDEASGRRPILGLYAVRPYEPDLAGARGLVGGSVSTSQASATTAVRPAAPAPVRPSAPPDDGMHRYVELTEANIPFDVRRGAEWAVTEAAAKLGCSAPDVRYMRPPIAGEWESMPELALKSQLGASASTVAARSGWTPPRRETHETECRQSRTKPGIARAHATARSMRTCRSHTAKNRTPRSSAITS